MTPMPCVSPAVPARWLSVVRAVWLGIYLFAVAVTSFFLGSQPDYVIPLVVLILIALIARPLYQRLDQGIELHTSARLTEVEE